MELFLGSPPPMEPLATRLDITNIDPFECLYHWVMVMSVAAFLLSIYLLPIKRQIHPQHL